VLCSFFHTSFAVSHFLVCLSSDVDMAKMGSDLAFTSLPNHCEKLSSGFKRVPLTYTFEKCFVFLNIIIFRAHIQPSNGYLIVGELDYSILSC